MQSSHSNKLRWCGGATLVLALAGFSDEAGLEKEFAAARKSLPAAHAALLKVEPSCRKEAIEAVLKCGFIANCSTKERLRIYWARVEGNKALVGRLVDEPSGGAYELDRVGGTFTIETQGADGRKLSRRWFLQEDKPALAEESEGEQLVCTPDDKIKEWGQIAPFLHRPQRIKNLLAQSVTIVRQTLECKGGTPGITTRQGLVIPVVDVPALSSSPPALNDAQANDLKLDSFRVRAERHAPGKRVRLFLQTTYPMLASSSGSDPRMGDRFEIWLPPPLSQPTCEAALHPERVCQTSAASGTRIVIGMAANKRVLVTDDEGRALQEVTASSNAKGLIIDLSGRHYDALTSGIAITYTVQATKRVEGTADVKHGHYGILDAVGALEPPSYEVKVIPVKSAGAHPIPKASSSPSP